MSDKILRPADAWTGELPVRESIPETPKIEVTPEFIQAYNEMPAAIVRQRYERDDLFRRTVDAMLSKGESLDV